MNENKIKRNMNIRIKKKNNRVADEGSIKLSMKNG